MPLLTSKPRTIIDHRGRGVPAWRLLGAGVNPDPFEVELGQRVGAANVRRVQTKSMIAFSIVFVAILVITLLGLPNGITIAGLVFLSFLFSMMMRRNLAEETSQVSATLLSAGRCASCAYPVAKLKPEPDGCITCPECGSAWKADPQWEQRLALADAAASERLNLPTDGSEDDQAVQRAARSFLGGLIGQRSLAMTDARGRLASVFYPRFPWRPPSCWSQVTPAHRKEIRSQIRSLGWQRRAGLILCLSFPLFAVAPRLMRLTFGGIVADPLLGIQALWVFIFLPLALFGFAVRPLVKRPEEMAQLFLGRGYCPSCAADLTKVGTVETRIRDCPHCLAAWELGSGV